MHVVDEKVSKVLTVELKQEDVDFLIALSDFPLWDAQPKEIQGRLSDLADALCEHGSRDEDEAKSYGFKPRVSFTAR